MQCDLCQLDITSVMFTEWSIDQCTLNNNMFTIPPIVYHFYCNKPVSPSPCILTESRHHTIAVLPGT